MKEIISIYVDGIGKIERYRQLSGVGHVDNGVIEEFTVNGEMALVKWFRHNRFEYNSKYVISIEYDN